MKRALGLYIDGTKLKAALVSREKDEFLIEQLDDFDLAQPLEAHETPIDEAVENAEQSDENPFGVDLSEVEESKESGGESHTNVDVLLEVMNKMCPKGTHVAFNLNDSNVYNKVFDSISERRPQKIRRAMWADFSNEEEEIDISEEKIEYLKRRNGSYLTFAHDDPLILTSLLIDSLRTIRSFIPRISLVDTIELALANEIVQSFNPEEVEKACVVFFSTSFIKIFFLREGEIDGIQSTIHEGVDIQTASETAYSKMMFTIDSGQVDEIDTVILCGEADRHNAYEYFDERLEDINVIHFKPRREKVSQAITIRHGTVASYAVAIAMAAKVLEDKPYPLYNINFLPDLINDKQAVYKINMYGMVALFLLAMSTVFLTFKGLQIGAEIKTARSKEQLIESKLSGLKTTAAEVDSLRAEIENLEKNTAIIDSLTKVTVKWSPIVEAFSEAFKDIGPFSIESMRNSGSGSVIIDLNLLEREQVVQLERKIRNSMIYKVVRENPIADYYNVQIQCNVEPGINKEYRNELRD